MSEAKIQLLGVLREATSQDYQRMRQAEDILKQWENEPSFFATLQDIFYDSSVEHDIRFLSGIYFKNGIDRFWRRTAKNPIQPEEKKAIRERLLQFIDEPSKKLTAQNAVIVARIARLDYPREWPELLSTMIQTLSNTNSTNEEYARLVHYRALEMLSEVLSELSTRLLSAGRKQFSEVAPLVFQAVAQIYLMYVDRTLSQLMNSSQVNLNESSLLVELNIVSICVKCLRILTVSGIKDVHKYDETRTFIEISLKHVKQFMECRNMLAQLLNGNDSKIKQDLESTIEEYGTLYLGLQKTHPISATLCPAWLDIVRYYWQHIILEGPRIITGQSTDIFESFLLQAMLLIKETIKYSGSKQKVDDDLLLSVTEEEKALTMESHRLIHEQFLTPQFVSMCAETLVSQYMLLTPRDFQKWEEDPEGWANDLDSENWEFELRPCAEVTFMSLLNYYRDQLVPIMLNLVERVATMTDQQSLLFKDAVYGAIGLGVHSLYGKLDFEPLVMNRLAMELRENKDNPNFRILRRRIGWMLGKWVNEGISADCRKVIYEILLELMAENEDLVVRLTAANGLKQAVDDWDFDISIVLPYLGTAMSLLMSLLNQVEESDTIMKLISYINSIMDRTGSDIIPYAGQIIQLLAPLWSPTTEPLLQSSLVITFTKITSILNEQSTQLHSILIPILRYCTDRNNEAHIYLLEDSLDLWWTLLQTTPHSSSDIMSLLPAGLELLDYDTENLRKVLKIIESYILLDPETTLQHSLTLFSKLAAKIGSSREHAASYIVHTIDLALQSAPLQVYGESLVQSGLLANILNILIQDQMYGYAVMNYMNLFSRLSIYDANFVIQMIQLTGQQQQDDILGSIFDRWLDKFDNLGQTRARKLACMGYTNLILTGNPSILNRLPNLMAIWSDVGPEIKETEPTDVLYSEVDMEGDIYEIDECAEKSRKNELYFRDPVYQTDLIQLIQQALNEPAIHMLLSQIDSTILDQIKHLI